MSTSNVTSLAGLQSHLATLGGEYLGSEVFWSLEDAKVARDRLESIWKSWGLDVTMLPEPQTPERALRLAVMDMKVKRQGLAVEQFEDSASALCYGVVVKDKDAKTGEAFGTVRAQIKLDRAQASVTIDVPTDETAQRIVELYKLYLTVHPTSDVMTSILRTLRSVNAIALRERGGVYFVLAQYADTLRRLKGAIAQIGHSKLYTMDIPATPNNHEAASDAATATIEAELERLGAEVQKFLTDPPQRTCVFANRIAEYEELRGQIRLMRESLTVAVGDADAALDAMREKMQAMLDKAEADRALKSVKSAA